MSAPIRYARGREAADTVSREAREALAKVAEAHGLMLEIGCVRYDDTRLSFTVNMHASAGDGITAGARAEWVRTGHMSGFALDDLGRTFTHEGREHRVLGFGRRMRNGTPVLTVDAEGRRYKWPIPLMRKMLHGTELVA